MRTLEIEIDGVSCQAEEGQKIIDAARSNGVYIPSLCNYPGIKPAGSCRVCVVKVNGRLLTSCSTPVSDRMIIESNTEEINDHRMAILDLMFTEGNHFCPSCEKSGNCELQALAYRYQIMVPRFPFQKNERDIDADHPFIIHDRNRCISCKRCIRMIMDKKGRSAFAFRRRGHRLQVVLDQEIGENMSEEMAQDAMDVCPVGSILKKEVGFKVPIGQRIFDQAPIGEPMSNIKEEAL
jgi:[NiFe] hydrogenase diaphorase moiety small subunit